MFGLARLGESIRDSSLYQEAVSDILYSNSEFIPAMIERCRMNLNIQAFDQLEESIEALLKADRNNIIGLSYQTWYALCRKGDLDEANESFERLFSIITDKEPNNYGIMVRNAQLMSKTCGRATQIINTCIRLLLKARKIDPLRPEPIIELANCNYMVSDYKEAFKLYQEAATIDIDNLIPSIGMLKCLIAQNKLTEAESQLEFLLELSSSMGGESSQLCFIEGMLRGRTHKNAKDFAVIEEKLKASQKALDKALKLHIQAHKPLPQNLEFYSKLNPDYIISLANELMYHAEFNLSQIRDRIQNPITPSYLIKKASKILETTLKKVPGLIPGYMLCAKAHLIVGNFNEALKSLQDSLDIDPKNEEAHILSAIILYSHGNLEAAYSSVKEALANNFDIDKNPFFMLFKGQIEFEKGDIEVGLKTLKMAYELPGVQTEEEASTIQQNRFMTVIEFNNNIRAQIFVSYAKALAQSKQNKQAQEIIENAIMEFAGTEDEPIVLLGNADMAILSGDLKKAISILKNVEPTAKGYMDARKKLANIYLNEMKQRRQYAKCYQDLAETFPNVEYLKLYGDALIQIQEPHQAIEVYQQALNLDGNNQNIVRLIGKAKSMTHNFQEATNYYEQAIEEFPGNLNLKIDYGNLLVKINILDVILTLTI